MAPFSSAEDASQQPNGGNGRHKWRFVSYRIRKEGDRFVIEDESEIYDGRTNQARSQVVVADIPLTQNALRFLEQDTDGADELTRRCNAWRNELDRRGVKVFYDFKRENGKIYPKWKYCVEGVSCSERILDVPAHIMELVRGDKRYFEVEEYRKWYGTRMQRKREQIIGECIARAYPDAGPAQKAEDALTAITEMLAGRSAQLFQLPDDAERFVQWASELAEELFVQKYGNALPLPVVRFRIASTLQERFSEQTALLSAVNNYVAKRVKIAA